MRQSIRHVSLKTIPKISKPTTGAPLPLGAFLFAALRPSVCVQCRFRTTTAGGTLATASNDSIYVLGEHRRFSSVTVRRKEEWPKVSIAGSKPEQSEFVGPGPMRPGTVKAELTQSVVPGSSPEGLVDSPGVPLNGSLVRPASDEDLPSAKEARRWRLSRWFNKMMDDLMPKMEVASQRINSYTGTDYSGIEGLRREIQAQEQLVKARHGAVQTAKAALDDTHAKASASQKEVVGLLERKHSWSATDLERYMALIRSEHVNEQAVQAAKDSVAVAEHALEEARTRLEKRERAQYHEEQIWSDTIRRNSTWVTFGLMGLNILLLLANVVLIEPWRRRRMVREIKATLEEKSAAAASASAFAAPAAAPAVVVEEDINAVVEPADLVFEELESTAEALSVAIPLGEVIVEEVEFAGDVEVPARMEKSNAGAWGSIKVGAQGLFSVQTVSIRRVDITTIALKAAAASAAVVGIVFMLLRPR